MQIVDPFTDVAYVGDGQTVYRLYETPRFLEYSRGALTEKPAGYNFFDEFAETKMKALRAGLYQYTVPFSPGNFIGVSGGGIELNGRALPLTAPAFTQTDEEGARISLYKNIYPNIDLAFKDSRQGRERTITFTRQPEHIAENDMYTFWETYTLPAGARVRDLDGNVYASGSTTQMQNRSLAVELADGSSFSISPATIFDQSQSDMYVQGLEQTVTVNANGRQMRIGIKVPASYLLDAHRIYPVVVDPIYMACGAGSLGPNVNCTLSGNNITNFYLRYLGSNDRVDPELYLGYYNAPDGHASRVPVLKFPLVNGVIPDNEQVTSANLILTYTRLGFGNYRGPVTTVARKIITAMPPWNDPARLFYSTIRAGLVDASPEVVINTNMVAGTEINYNITNTFNQWKQNSATNEGIAIEPRPAWPNGNVPPWPNVLFRFRSSRYAGNDNVVGRKGPYLDVRTQAAGQPDLVNSSFDTGSQNNVFHPGDTMNFSNVVRNNGAVAVPAGSNAHVKYYFKQTSATYNDNYDVGNYNLNNLLAGNTQRIDVPFTIPADTVPGNYKFYFWIDWEGRVAESSDNNNKVEINITVDPPLQADLRYSNTQLSSNSVLPGDTVTLQVRATNNGQAAASRDGYVYYYFAPNAASYNDNDRFGSDYFPQLAVGAGSDESISYTIPAGTAPGTYYFSLWVDAQNNVVESNENNNQASFQITVRGGQDLIPSNLQVMNARRVLSGEELSITARIRNNGNLAANNVHLTYVMENINTGLRYPLQNQVPVSLNLAAGYDNAMIIQGIVPADIPITGSYQMRLELDSDQTIAETVEGNNTDYTATVLVIERNGYCGGCGGGGNVPEPGSLPSTAGDGTPDTLKVYAGFDINTRSDGQTVPFFSPPKALQNNAIQPDHKQDSYGGDPVNLRTGSFEFTQEDFALPGRGIPISLVRTYNSRVTDMNNRVGNGWNLSAQMFYYQDEASKNIQMYLGGALISEFMTNDGGVTFTSPVGVDDTLTVSNDIFTYRTIDGLKYIFARRLTTNLGILSQVQDTFGNSTNYEYTVVRDIPLLTRISDPSGRAVTFTYGNLGGPTWDKIVSITENTDPAHPHTITYVYDGALNLTEVHDTRFYNNVAEESVKRYTYVDKRLTTYTDARGTILYNTYDLIGRVTHQYEFNPRIDAAGTKRLVYELAYTDIPDPQVAGSVSCTLVTNYRGDGTDFTDKTCFDVNGLKIYMQNGAGDVTRMAYSASGMMTSLTDANGNVHQLFYDNRRRVTREVFPDTADWHTETTYTYENTFNRLTQKQETATSRLVPPAEQIQRTTDYVINNDNGSITSITDGARNTESFIYDGFGNVTRHTTKNNGVQTFTYDANNNYLARESMTVQQADGANQTITTQYTYDPYGHRITITSPRNNVSRFEYDSAGNLRKEIDAAGSTITYTYDLENHRTSMTDRLGHVTNYSYDSDISESLLSTEHVGANGSIITRTDYDWLGNAKRVTDARGTVATVTRNGANRVTQRTDPLNTVTYLYDGNGNKTREVQGVGSLDQRTDYTYDARDQIVSVKRYTDANTFVETRYQYDGLGRKVKEINPNGGVSIYEYDVLDHLTAVTDPLGNRSRFAYDVDGNKIAELSARGNATNYEYDRAGRRTKVTDALSKTSLFFYDADSHVIRTIDRQDANGGNATHAATATFNELGRKTQETDAMGATATFAYDLNGNVTAKTDQMNRTTTYVYDSFDRLTEEHNPAGAVTRYAYDANSNKVSVTLPDGTVTTSVYDAANRVTSVTDPLNQSEQFTYDAVGNSLRHTDKRGLAVTFAYNNLNRVLSEQNPQNTITTYTYDNNGNRLSETMSGVTTSYQFDANNQLTRVTHPGNKVENYTYDANGNALTKIDGKGSVMTFTYDALDRATNKLLADNTSVQYVYDNWGNVVSVTEPSGTTTETYDAMNRPVREDKTLTGIANRTYTITRGYNADNQPAFLEDAGQKRVTYTYNNLGLLQNASYLGQAIATYTYNQNNQPTALAYRNGITQSYTYDSLMRVTQLSINNAQNQNLFRHDYTYDANSNRTQTTEVTAINAVNTNRTMGYSYDTLNQLTGVDYSDVAGNADLQFTYDTNGNRLTFAAPHATSRYTYTNGTQELASYTKSDRVNVALTYDGNGSITREAYTRLGKAVKNVDYQWDAQNRLSQISMSDASRPAFMPAATANTLTFAYDDAGNRVRKTVNNTDTTYYVNNGLTVLNELSAQGDVTKSIIQGLSGFGGQLADIDAQGNLTFIHTDTLGSPLLLTNAAGAVVQEYDYDPFGAIIGTKGAAGSSVGGASTKYLFTNQEFDPESNLSYYNARYYNAQTGRFISRDSVFGTVGNSLSRNLYIYVQNNPLRFTDPTGHETKQEKAVNALPADKDPLLVASIFLITPTDYLQPYRPQETENNDLPFFYNATGKTRDYVMDAAKLYNVPPEVIAVVLQLENGEGTIKSYKRGAKQIYTYFGNNVFGLDDSHDNGMGYSEGLSNTKPAHAATVVKHLEKYYPNSDMTKMADWSRKNLSSNKGSINIVGAGMRRSIDDRFGVNYSKSLSIEQMAEMAARHNTPDAPANKDSLEAWIQTGRTPSSADIKQKDFQHDIDYAQWLLERHFNGIKSLNFMPQPTNTCTRCI